MTYDSAIIEMQGGPWDVGEDVDVVVGEDVGAKDFIWACKLRLFSQSFHLRQLY